MSSGKAGAFLAYSLHLLQLPALPDTKKACIPSIHSPAHLWGFVFLPSISCFLENASSFIPTLWFGVDLTSGWTWVDIQNGHGLRSRDGQLSKPGHSEPLPESSNHISLSLFQGVTENGELES